MGPGPCLTAAYSATSQDLMDAALAAPEGHLAGLTALAAWLRLAATRRLRWNVNYNVKPREISAAQVRLLPACCHSSVGVRPPALRHPRSSAQHARQRWEIVHAFAVEPGVTSAPHNVPGALVASFPTLKPPAGCHTGAAERAAGGGVGGAP